MPMKSISRNFIVAIFALTAFCDALGADDKWLENEALGKISLGRKAADLTALIGTPESRGKETEWDAIGEWVQEWRFKSHGLVLNMSSKSKGGEKSVLTITATAPCKLTTARGIHIGSTIADVTKAYGNVQDKEESISGKTFVAGSIYGGIIFTFTDGKASQMFIGATAE
jgi:hypothetical protein